jgi:hypothetical protein
MPEAACLSLAGRPFERRSEHLLDFLPAFRRQFNRFILGAAALRVQGAAFYSVERTVSLPTGGSHCAPEFRIPRAVLLTHPARTNSRENFIGAQAVARSERPLGAQ